jgi:hypothetical protein
MSAEDIGEQNDTYNKLSDRRGIKISLYSEQGECEHQGHKKVASPEKADRVAGIASNNLATPQTKTPLVPKKF